MDKSEFNSIQTLVSQPLIDMEIIHEKFILQFQRREIVWENERKRDEGQWKTTKYETK